MNERRGREHWNQQVAEWRCSGLSKNAYCEQHGHAFDLRHLSESDG